MPSGIQCAKARGFTLVELMVVVVIAAILAVVAVPSLRVTLRNNQLDTVSNQLVAALATARSEAVRAPEATVRVKNPNAGTQWNAGWNTTIQAPGAAAETPLQAPTAAPGQLSVVSNQAGPISFDAMGRLLLGALNPPPTVIFIVCVDGTQPPAGQSRAVIVSPSGRASIAHLDPTGTPVNDVGAPIASCTAP